MSLTLSPAELRELTGRARRDGQRAWLTERGIPFRVDGERTIVARHHVLGWLAGEHIAPSRAVDLSAVR